jgi:hypothetical protein
MHQDLVLEPGEVGRDVVGGGAVRALPLSQLEAINPDESSREAIGDWLGGSELLSLIDARLPKAHGRSERTTSWEEGKAHTRMATPGNHFAAKMAYFFAAIDNAFRAAGSTSRELW